MCLEEIHVCYDISCILQEVAILWLHQISSYHCKISSCVYMYIVLCTHCSRVVFGHKISKFSFVEKQIPSVGYSEGPKITF